MPHRQPYTPGKVFTTDADLPAETADAVDKVDAILVQESAASRERHVLLRHGWLQAGTLIVSLCGVYWTLHNEVAINKLRIDQDHEQIVELQQSRDRDREKQTEALQRINDKIDKMSDHLNRLLGHFDGTVDKS